MKELKEFTVERLERMIESDHAQTGDVAALAKIALAAKQADPDYYLVRNDLWGEDGILSAHENHLDASKFKDDHGGEIIPLYTTPPLNHTEQDGWIKCSERMPEDRQIVVIIDAGHGQIYEAATVTRHGPHFLLLDGLEASNYDGGAVVTLRLEATHWMPLPAAPKHEV